MDQEKELQMYEEWLMSDEAEELIKAYNQISGLAE